MYAQAGLIQPFMQGFPQGTPETQHNDFFPAVEDDLICTFLSSAALELDGIIPMPTISEYDLGAAGDLFKDPKPILGDPVLALDPVADAMPMMTGDRSMISAETTEADSLSSLPDEELLNEEFYKCKRELIAVSAILESPSPGASEVEAAAAAIQSENTAAADQNVLAVEGPLQKSVSFGCTSSAIPGNGGDARPKLLVFREVRSHGPGDMKNFGSSCSVFGDTNMAPSFKLLSAFRDVKIEDRIEERRQKIFRYQKKKTKRNFGRKIKYACRKALADSQPRVRGRFARADRQANAEDHEVGKKCLDL